MVFNMWLTLWPQSVVDCTSSILSLFLSSTILELNEYFLISNCLQLFTEFMLMSASIITVAIEEVAYIEISFGFAF